MIVKNRSSSGAHDIALIAIFAGIVAALGVVPAFQPFGSPVPITAQSLGVILAGAILGARRGFLSLALFIGLVAIGLPLLAGGRGGLAVFGGPSVGFIVGFPFAALIVGWLTERAGKTYRLTWGAVANVIGGVAFLYVPGVVGIAVMANLSLDTAWKSVWLFLPGDLAKAIVAALIARGVHQAYPGLLNPSRHHILEDSAV